MRTIRGILAAALAGASPAAAAAPVERTVPIEERLGSPPVLVTGAPAVLVRTFAWSGAAPVFDARSAPAFAAGAGVAPATADPVPSPVAAAAESAAFPAEADAAIVAPAAVSRAEPPSEIVALKMPSGRVIRVMRGIMDAGRKILLAGPGPDGVLLDFGPSETSFGFTAGSLMSEPADWALVSHDGRVLRVQRGRGGDRPGYVGGTARSVLVVDRGRARKLGLVKGASVPELRAGSAVVEAFDAMLSGEWSPEGFAEKVKENGAPEPRHFLDALVARFEAAVRMRGADAARAAQLRTETLTAVARHPRIDGSLRMQAATRLFLDDMPRALFRFNQKWPRKLVTTYNYVDVWFHETGHELMSRLLGVPVEEKRVFAHGAGFIVNPRTSVMRRVAIDAAGGAAEAAVGAVFAVAGVALAWSAQGAWLAAAALPAAALILFGVAMAFGSAAHAKSDFRHACEALGWARAQAFIDEAAEEADRDAAARNMGIAVPAHVFYLAVLRIALRRWAARP